MVVPEIALVDPQTTVTMPPALTAATGMDALCHSFEAYVSSASSAITDMAALRSVQLIANNLVGAYNDPKDMACRDNMMMASLMAGMAFSNASLGLVHAMAHSLGGGSDLPHGECNAVLLEAVVRYNFPAAADKYTQLAAAMGIQTDGLSADAVVEALVDRLSFLRQRVGVTQGLKELGLRWDEIPRLAQNASTDSCLATNPRGASPAEIAKIFEAIY